MAWTMFFLFVVLKVPILLACWLIWWAVRAVPDLTEEDAQDDGGSDRPPTARPRKPRPPRRGPHGDPAPSAPSRVRAPVRDRPSVGRP